MLKEKIIASLKQRYANVGLSDKTIETIAEMLGSTVADEAQIETAVAGVENIVKAFQSESDSRVTSAVAKAKAEKTTTTEPKKPAEQKQETTTPQADDASALSKAINEALAPLLKEVQSLKSEKLIDTRKAQLEAKTKEMPESYRNTILKNFGRMNFETDEAFAEYLAETETDFKAFEADLTKQGVTNFPAPGRGNATPPKVDDKEVASLVEKLLNN